MKTCRQRGDLLAERGYRLLREFDECDAKPLFRPVLMKGGAVRVLRPMSGTAPSGR